LRNPKALNEKLPICLILKTYSFIMMGKILMKTSFETAITKCRILRKIPATMFSKL
jgi:hypothetical protein